jgi:hypothetical protein
VIENAPRLAIAIGSLVDAVILVMATNAPKLVAAGYKLLNDILNGISQNIVQVTNKVAEIITKFLNALAAKQPQLTAAGANLLTKFLQGITTQIPKVVTTVGDMVVKFINALSQNINRITTAGQNLMIKFIASIALFVPRLVQEGIKLLGNFISGISRNINQVVSKGADLIIKFIQGITSNMNKIANKGADAVIKFLHGLAATIREKGPQLRAAGWDVANALIDGIWQGIHELGQKVVDKLGALVKLLPGKVKKLLGIASPSSVFAEIGRQTVEGLARGVDDPGMKGKVSATTTSLAKMIPESFRNILGIHSPSEVMKAIGQQVNEGFAQGLRGSVSDIRGAFNDLNTKLVEQINTSRETIASEQDKLNDLLQAKKPDTEAINAAKQAIAEETQVLNMSRSARQTLLVGLNDEEKRLVGLTKRYDDVSKKLETAVQVLADAKAKRDEAQKGFADQFGATPEVGKDTTLEDYKKSLADRLAATKSFGETLQKLRLLGLDDTTYKKLLEQGLDAKGFAEQLLAGGKTAVEGVNALDSQLRTVAASMAKQAASNLYQAGVNAAQGLVNGLKSKKKALANSMDELADGIIAAIKKKLKIKSPSEEFKEVGRMSVEGFAKGIKMFSPSAKSAVEDMATDAVKTGKVLFRLISPRMFEGLTPPVITPILDMTNVEKGAKQIGAMGTVIPITAATSFGLATDISAKQPTVSAGGTAGTLAPTTSINFEQNNYSPDPISNIELYRQTNNQLARIKSAVGAT